MTTAAAGTSRSGTGWAVMLIALLLGMQAVLLSSSARTLSPTADEVLHCVGAYRVRHLGDYAIDREDPPGFLFLASLGVGRAAVPTELTGEHWARSRLGADPPEAYLAAVMADPRVDVEGIVRSARGVFVWVTVLVGAGVAATAWWVAVELGRGEGGGCRWRGRAFASGAADTNREECSPPRSGSSVVGAARPHAGQGPAPHAAGARIFHGPSDPARGAERGRDAPATEGADGAFTTSDPRAALPEGGNVPHGQEGPPGGAARATVPSGSGGVRGRTWGPVAGVVAAGLWAMEPLVLGHGALVKNDVLLAGIVLGAAVALGAVCRRASWWAVAGLLLAAAAAPMAKFSGLLVPAVAVPLVLGVRALAGGPWAWGRWGRWGGWGATGAWQSDRSRRGDGASRAWQSDAPATDGATPTAAPAGRGVLARAGGVAGSWGGRLLLAAGLTAAVWVSAWAAAWGCYGFRFFASPEGRTFDYVWMVYRVKDLDAAGQAGARGAQASPAATRPATPWNAPVFVQAVTAAHNAEWLPEAMCVGLLYTYGSTLHRPAFLLGEYSDVGFAPEYFPVAWAVKSPLATSAMVLLSGVWILWQWCRALGSPVLVAAGGVAGLFLAASLATRLNIGLRHLMPLYPLLFVMAGVAAAGAWGAWGAWGEWGGGRRVGRGGVVAGLVLLAVESLPHRGEHLQFFNALAGGSRGGLGLLSDSNLDWGQDLYRLAEWQRENPRERLWLIYFGPMDPRRVGIRATNAPGSWAPSASPLSSPPPGAVLAISATHLQGTYFGPELRAAMARWRAREPLAVLGGTIYLYRVE